jgi:outer membrane protein assembly factor BamB
VAADGVAYIGIGYPTALGALDAATGKQLWTLAPGSGTTMPAVAEGMAYVGVSGDLYALDAVKGSQIWKAATGFASEWGSPVVANGVVYFGGAPSGSPGSLDAFDAATGRQLWSAVIDGDPGAGMTGPPPAVANGMVYVTGGGNLYAFGLPPGSAAARAVQPPARPDPATLKPDLELRP